METRTGGMMMKQIFKVALTVLLAAIVVYVAVRVLVGLLKLLVVGIAIGIGAMLTLYFILKVRAMMKGNGNRDIRKY